METTPLALTAIQIAAMHRVKGILTVEEIAAIVGVPITAVRWILADSK